MNYKTFLRVLLLATLLFCMVQSQYSAAANGLDSSQKKIYLPLVVKVYSNVPGNMGALAYTLDTSRQHTAIYNNDGSPVTLTVTDAKGYVWTLTIPNNALLWPQQITMTPFATLDDSQSSAKPTSGVQLEPDGLQFSAPVSLSVAPPSANPGVGLIFSLNQGGTDVQFSATTDAGSTATTQIFHFSSAAYNDGSDAGQALMNYYQQNAAEEYQWAKANANQFIKNGTPAPPTPPVVSQFCRGTEANPENGEFYVYTHAFLEPYTDVVMPLFSSMRTLTLLGDSSVDTSAGMQLAEQVTQMAVQSILQIGAQVQGEQPPDRLMAVITTALEAERRYELLSNSTDSIPAQVVNWAVTIRDYYFDQLKTHHDYRAYPVIINLDKDVSLLGGTALGLGAIGKAMTFEIVADTSFTMTGSSSAHVEQHADLTKDEINWNYGYWYSPITFQYTTGYLGPENLIAGQSYHTYLTMWNWDACVTHTVDLIEWAGFGGEEFYENIPAPEMIAETAGAAVFNDLVVHGGPGGQNAIGYMMTIPLQNLNPTLGDHTFSSTKGTITGQIHFQVIHTPQ